MFWGVLEMVGIYRVPENPLHAFNRIAVINHNRILCGVAWNVDFLGHPLGASGEEFHETMKCLRSLKRKVKTTYLVILG